MSAAVPFRRLDVSHISYGSIAKDRAARLYVVPIDPPMVVQTTPMTLVTGLDDPEIPFVYVRPDTALQHFFKQVERTIADACVEHKQEWFAVAKDLDDAALRRGFKTFFDRSKGFKLKVPQDVPCFDEFGAPIGREDISAGSVVRAAIELSRICFGRHEYGASWRVVQLKLVSTTCLIRDEPVDDEVVYAPTEHGDDSDLDEFL